MQTNADDGKKNRADRKQERPPGKKQAVDQNLRPAAFFVGPEYDQRAVTIFFR